MKASFGEVAVAILIAGAMAAVAAFAGLVGGFFFSAWLFPTGEGRESILMIAPVATIVPGVLVFVIAFRRIISYGNSEDE